LKGLVAEHVATGATWGKILTMQTRVSTKGQIIRTPLKKRPPKGRIIADPVTGLPVLSAGADAPALSSKEVEEIVANFP
jgi:hypothetical protein